MAGPGRPHCGFPVLNMNADDCKISEVEVWHMLCCCDLCLSHITHLLRCTVQQQAGSLTNVSAKSVQFKNFSFMEIIPIYKYIL